MIVTVGVGTGADHMATRRRATGLRLRGRRRRRNGKSRSITVAGSAMALSLAGLASLILLASPRTGIVEATASSSVGRGMEASAAAYASYAASYTPAVASGTGGDSNPPASADGNPLQKCERLPSSLSYPQDTAPADASAFLGLVMNKINRDVSGVVNVDVQWTGRELHRRVGEWMVKCTVTRLVEAVVDSTDDGDREEETSDGSPLSVIHEVDDFGRIVVSQCFEVPFYISDVNECAVSTGHAYAHRCPAPSACVNTIGSYECLCPSLDRREYEQTIFGYDFAAGENFWDEVESEARSSWEKSVPSSSETSCPGSASTRGCCDGDAHGAEGRSCRAEFRCPIDPCKGGAVGGGSGSGNGGNRKRPSTKRHGCAPNAFCQRSLSPLDTPAYTCVCPSGFLGNGKACRPGVDAPPAPTVKFDGVTPTEETVRANYCSCTEPVVDACSGFPKCPGKHETCTVAKDNSPFCACKSGFVYDLSYGCVDETPPVLRVRARDGSAQSDDRWDTVLMQGDSYVEFGVDIHDGNAEEYLRSLKITYSRPLPRGCLYEMGEFSVNYTVATPWTDPEYIRATRRVLIENVDECTLDSETVRAMRTTCPELVPMCDANAGAVCIDEVGTYDCKCPEGTVGDGFLSISRIRWEADQFVGAMVPRGYAGGTGCRDTRRPVIDVLGPNPKRFRVAKCRGLTGILPRDGSEVEGDERLEHLCAEQRNGYENDVKAMIKSTAGAELCATHVKPHVRPTDCVRATDQTHKGVVDLTARVSVGEPILKDGRKGSGDGNSDLPSLLHWRVPYNVMDDAGNKAKTAWRDIVVEEVDLSNVENRIKTEVLASRRDEIDHAVDEALAGERKRVVAAEFKRNKATTRDCPACPTCDCRGKTNPQHHGSGLPTRGECEKFCDSSAAESPVGGTDTCGASYSEDVSPSDVSGYHMVRKILLLAEGFIGPSAVLLVLIGCTLIVLLCVLQRIASALFRSGPLIVTYYHSSDDDERERVMMEHVAYYSSPRSTDNSTGTARQQNNNARQHNNTPGSTSSVPAPPTVSLASQLGSGGVAGNGIFSPQENRVNMGPGHFGSSDRNEGGDTGSRGGGDGIYQSMSPITPSRNGTPGNTSSRRSPYNRGNY